MRLASVTLGMKVPLVPSTARCASVQSKLLCSVGHVLLQRKPGAEAGILAYSKLAAALVAATQWQQHTAPQARSSRVAQPHQKRPTPPPCCTQPTERLHGRQLAAPHPTQPADLREPCKQGQGRALSEQWTAGTVQKTGFCPGRQLLCLPQGLNP